MKATEKATDWFGFLGPAAAWILNPGKVREATVAAGKASVAGATRAVVVFSEYFGRVVGPMLYKFLLFFQAPVFLVWMYAAWKINSGIDKVVQKEGIADVIKMSGLLGFAAIVGMALYQRWAAEKAPRRVSVFNSGIALLVAWGVNIVLLFIHALLVKSQGLYWLDGAGIIIALANFRMITGFIAWATRKVIEGVEVSEETVAELMTLLPGLTSENLHEKLGRILDILPEEWIEYTMNSWPVKVGLVVLSFWLFISLHVSMGWAGLVGAVYAVVIVSSWLAGKADLEDKVEERRKAFFTWLLKWMWLIALAVRLIALHPGLSRGFSLLAGQCGDWFSDMVRLHGPLVAYHKWYANIFFVAIGSLAIMGVRWFTASKDDKDKNGYKTALRVGLGGFFGYIALVGMIGLIMNNAGFGGGGTAGWPNVSWWPTTQAQLIELTAEPHNETTDTSVSVSWETKEEATCFLHFKIQDPFANKWVDYGDLNAQRLDEVKLFERPAITLTAEPKMHYIKITGLKHGWTVFYQIQCKHTAGDYIGDWSGMGDDWHHANALPPPPKPEPSGPIGPTGPTGSAAAPSASASALAAPGKAAPVPRKGGSKALPKLPAPGATTASAPELSTALGNMRASLAALKKKDH